MQLISLHLWYGLLVHSHLFCFTAKLCGPKEITNEFSIDFDTREITESVTDGALLRRRSARDLTIAKKGPRMSVLFSKSLSAGDIRAMLTIVADVSRHTGTPAERYLHLLRALVDLTHARLGVVTQIRRTSKKPLHIISIAQFAPLPSNTSPSTHKAATINLPSLQHPILAADIPKRAIIPPDSLTTPDAADAASSADASDPDSIADLLQSRHPPASSPTAHADNCAYSIYHLGHTGHYACLALHAHPHFSPRERDIVDFVWQSLPFLHELPLQSDLPTPAAFPPIPDHLRALANLLRHLKSTARAHKKLGLSPKCFRQQLRELYAHFQARTRRELLQRLPPE